MSARRPPEETQELGAALGSDAVASRDAEALYGGRFELGALLGEGGSGAVHEAFDRVTQRTVALKRVGPLRPADARRVRREVAALRMLSVPGVVRLVDAGFIGDGAWIAMARAVGVPFPPGPWAEVEAPARALLSTLMAMHAQGVVHRDIKPANVLVDDAGRPTLVDLGLAWGAPLLDVAPATQHGVVTGTPRYMSPEQLRGERPRPASDLFSVGVMLYEALSGALPFPDEGAGTAFDPRLTRSAAPLHRQNTGAPRLVCDLVDRMLRRAPEERPSAADALRALGGEPLPDPLRLPWLGPTQLIDALLERLSAGGLHTLGGGRGQGRSRALEEVGRRLERVAWVVQGERPFESLRSVVGLPPEQLDAAGAEAWLRAALGRRDAVLLIDDWGGVDHHSRALIEAYPGPRGALRVTEGAAALQPLALEERDLKPLFRGPDRVLHLREDAARELFRRSAGRPAAVRDQLYAWLRAKELERLEGGEAPFAARREVMQRWASELVIPAGEGASSLGAPAEGLLQWVRFCGDNASEGLLERVCGLPRWELELLLGQLRGAGALEEREGTLIPSGGTVSWGDVETRAAHAAVAAALPLGRAGRLRHLIAAGVREGVEEQAIAESEVEETEGRLGQAAALLAAAIGVAEDPERLRPALVRVWLAQRTPESLEQAAFLARGSEDGRLLALVEVARRVRQERYAGARELLRELDGFEVPAMQMERLALEVEALRDLSPATQAARIEAMGALRIVRDDPSRQARWLSWLGLARYKQRRFAEAAALHERAAARAARVGVMSSLNNAAASWLEACELQRAADAAAQLREMAVDARHARWEVEAEWALRSVENRRGAVAPDLGLLSCVEALSVDFLLGRVALVEAFIARRGRHPEALRLATCAQSAFARSSGASAVTAYAGALVASLGGEGLADADVQRLWSAREALPEVTLDALALLATTEAELPGDAADWGRLLDALLPGSGAVIRGAMSPERALDVLRSVRVS